MAYKMAAPEAPPSTIKPPKPEGVQKDSTAAANQDKLRKNEPVAKTEQFGYIVTNQRYRMLVSSLWFNQSDEFICVNE